ncbi:uncharacterized protein LOC142233033 isoform X2 [Haematobia irritans]
MFLNTNLELTSICVNCWDRMANFWRFQQKAATTVGKTQQVSQGTTCMLCSTSTDVSSLEENVEALQILNRFFDIKLTNVIKICCDCWKMIFEFHKFQESVLHGQKINDKCIKLSEIPGLDNDESRAEFPVDVKSDKTDYITNGFDQIVVKEEPELELIDIHNESEHELYTKFQETSSMYYKADVNKVHNTNAISKKENKEYIEYNSSDEERNDSDPMQRSYEKRKTIPELDAIIAQWRPVLHCPYCRNTATTFTLLQGHCHTQHPGRKCYITCCQCKLRTHYYIEEHIRYHADATIFNCEICGQENRTRLRLKRHKDYWHSGPCKTIANDMPSNNNDLLCLECGKRPKTLGALRKHLHRHEAKRKFKCAVCDKGFRGRTDLRTHLATHGENACPYCPMTFKFLSKLKRHLKQEHADMEQIL